MEAQLVGTFKTKLMIDASENMLEISFFGNRRISISKVFNVNNDGTVNPVTVNWGGLGGSQDPETTREFARFLTMAASIAETLDYTIERKADFKRIELIPFHEKAKQQDYILVADLNGVITIMYPGKWVE